MKTIKVDLPEEFKEIEIHLFADEHIGDELSDIARLQRRIDYVKQTPNAYCIFNGDLMDNATKQSVGDVYTQAFNPMEQLKVAVKMFEPIKDKVLAVTHGNHENRSYKDVGINMSELIAAQLGIEERFTDTSALIFVRVGTKTQGNGKQQCYTIYTLHGSGGGRRAGAKANRLSDMASIVDADCYVHSHTHLPMIMKEKFYRVNYGNSSVAPVTKLFVNTASNLEYGGYGERGEFKPSSNDMPVIHLSGARRGMWATL